MSTELVIVESPAKAKTIERFLGKGYRVTSSYGHVRDLAKRDMGIDIANNFTPFYEVSERSRKTVNTLKKMRKEAAMVWLAMDQDREGEAIAWHLVEVLGLKSGEYQRITFNEITKSAVQRAIQNPRDLNMGLVNAQQARRVLDRLVGFELSPVLWRKVRTGLSAGRVQSVAVRLVIEKERDIEAHTAEITWRMKGEFSAHNTAMQGVWQGALADSQAVAATLEALKNTQLVVQDIAEKPSKSSPAKPFTTSTLQQVASQRLGYSVSQTMRLAQRLYEAGDITYMRTDSVNLSEQALGQIGEYITAEYGAEYHQLRRYQTKSSTAQEAHEAIRPANVARTVPSGGAEAEGARLYNLIWQRTVACQMADAKLQKTVVALGGAGLESVFQVTGEKMVFPGWMVLGGKHQAVLLPDIAVGDAVATNTITARETFSRPPARYSEAALVQRLEALGIGRPSTYAPTISTIQERGYVEKSAIEAVMRPYQTYTLENGEITAATLEEKTGEEKGRLIPTAIAGVVNDFLIKQFPEVVDYQFTANLEQQFDDVITETVAWTEMIGAFYGPFHKQVDAAQHIERSEIHNARELGTDPKTGKPVTAKVGRYGPYVQIGTKDDEAKPQFATLKKDQKIDTIKLDEALALFALPRSLGTAPNTITYTSKQGEPFTLEAGTELKANQGRFGPYIQYGPKKFVSLKGDPYTVELPEALELVDKKLEAEANKVIAMFGDISILNGRYGPYVTDGATNATVGKHVDAASLDEAAARKILADKGKPVRGAARRGSTKTAAKPTKPTKAKTPRTRRAAS